MPDLLIDRWGINDDRTALAHGAIVFASLLVYVLVSRIGHHRRQPSAAVAWVLLIAMLPYVGLPLFLVFGTRKVVRPRRSARMPGSVPIEPARRGDGQSSEGAVWVDAVLAAMQMPPAVPNASVRFHPDGRAALAALLETIDASTRHLDVATFILGNDETGDTVVKAMARAADRGVRVRLLLDAFGSFRVARRQREQLAASKVQVRRFMPLLNNPLRGRINLRNHRKVVIADGSRLWTGGRNLAAEYFPDEAAPAVATVPGAAAAGWVDLTFSVVGPVAGQASDRFERDWEAADGRRVVRVSGEVSPTALLESRQRVCAGGEGASLARLIPSGPDLADDTVYAVLLTAAYHVQERLFAVTPYFVPDEALLLALTMAARRGVAVTVIVPAQSNHRLADLARTEALRRMVAAGARVMLYPRMIHAKAIVVDRDFALCGSVNLDSRSLFLNYELMVGFHGRAEVGWLAGWFDERIRESVEYDPVHPSWSRDLLEGIVRAVGYQL